MKRRKRKNLKGMICLIAAIALIVVLFIVYMQMFNKKMDSDKEMVEQAVEMTEETSSP